MFDRDLCVIDLETTGLNPYEGHEIIEIGIVLADGRTLERQFEKEIKIIPQNLECASPKALEINGYYERDWSDAIDLDSAILSLRACADGRSMVAHNATFDWHFLLWAFSKCGAESPFHYHRYDTMSMFRAINPDAESDSLSYASEYYGLDPEPEIHSALNGALQCHRLLGVMF